MKQDIPSQKTDSNKSSYTKEISALWQIHEENKKGY